MCGYYDPSACDVTLAPATFKQNALAGSISAVKFSDHSGKCMNWTSRHRTHLCSQDYSNRTSVRSPGIAGIGALGNVGSRQGGVDGLP